MNIMTCSTANYFPGSDIVTDAGSPDYMSIVAVPYISRPFAMARHTGVIRRMDSGMYIVRPSHSMAVEAFILLWENQIVAVAICVNAIAVDLRGAGIYVGIIVVTVISAAAAGTGGSIAVTIGVGFHARRR